MNDACLLAEVTPWKYYINQMYQHLTLGPGADAFEQIIMWEKMELEYVIYIKKNLTWNLK